MMCSARVDAGFFYLGFITLRVAIYDLPCEFRNFELRIGETINSLHTAFSGATIRNSRFVIRSVLFTFPSPLQFPIIFS